MKRTYIIIYSLLTIFFVGCTDNFEDFNTDKKNPAIVTGNAVFTNAQKGLADQVNQTSVNQNNFKLLSQYWTETTYTDEANYDFITRNWAATLFRYYIRESLEDFSEASRLISEEESVTGLATKQNRLAIIELLRSYAYGQLVDIFGMVPYSEALDITNVYPKYDDGAVIYSDLISRIDAAISQLDETQDSFGSADLFYGGDVAAWIKFANALKIKFGITIADINPTLAKSTVESGVVGGAFASFSDGCLMPYLSAAPNYNPLYAEIVATNRKDYVIANTITDVMNSLDDPRRALYFTDIDGEYIGGEYGYPSSYTSYSHINEGILAPDFPGLMLTYTETLFYLAEAAERGFTVGKTAEEYYNMGITESILEWGGTQAEATAYLAQADVAYATAPDTSTDGWRQKIGTQSWIANYTKGLEAWTTWRRLDYPVFNVPPSVETVMEIPTRIQFPVEEQTLNPGSYAEAAEAVGGDELTTKIFWDLHDANE